MELVGTRMAWEAIIIAVIPILQILFSLTPSIGRIMAGITAMTSLTYGRGTRMFSIRKEVEPSKTKKGVVKIAEPLKTLQAMNDSSKKKRKGKMWSHWNHQGKKIRLIHMIT